MRVGEATQGYIQYLGALPLSQVDLVDLNLVLTPPLSVCKLLGARRTGVRPFVVGKLVFLTGRVEVLFALNAVVGTSDKTN